MEWLWYPIKFHQAYLDINVGGFSVEFQWKPGENPSKILVENTILKINMLHNLSCLETRFRLAAVPLIAYCAAA